MNRRGEPPPRKPPAKAPPRRPMKGDLDRRQRPNVKPSPKVAALDREYRRRAG